jgi:hypothetical protein
MPRRLIFVLAIALVASMPLSAAAAVQDGPVAHLKKWCERFGKTGSFNLNEATLERLSRDLERQLKLLKVTGAATRVSVDNDQLLIHVDFKYAVPERYVVDKIVENGIVIKYTERVDYGWVVYVAARKGKLLKSIAQYDSKYFSY